MKKKLNKKSILNRIGKTFSQMDLSDYLGECINEAIEDTQLTQDEMDWAREHISITAQIVETK